MRSLRVPAATLLTLFALSACSGGQTAPASGGASASASATGTNRDAEVEATFAEGQGAAITYLPELVPAGATAKVTSSSGDGTSTVTLELTGLVPNRHYGAHAHTKACGAAPADSGPHFQHEKDPVTPSVDPAYANPQNEIWLDFETDAEGKATATSTVNWDFTDGAHPQSVVVHSNHTATEPGKAGTAGDRAACVTVDF
ncbi:superoxide dismutase family protein [Pseudonocardia bannensis]|uniref:Superoxide dismutase family protein n=1 Tax=Pseudonocardia bannensis TaxID=630973 RepID=A0A848DKD0_9PSEU|nr:superoxide dismutase family protein [Pseudonocardia bannensis]NMH92884.1 superoxide dismutase family protein [Pseudonocardia bannensis]